MAALSSNPVHTQALPQQEPALPTHAPKEESATVVQVAATSLQRQFQLVSEMPGPSICNRIKCFLLQKTPYLARVAIILIISAAIIAALICLHATIPLTLVILGMQLSLIATGLTVIVSTTTLLMLPIYLTRFLTSKKQKHLQNALANETFHALNTFKFNPALEGLCRKNQNISQNLSKIYFLIVKGHPSFSDYQELIEAYENINSLLPTLTEEDDKKILEEFLNDFAFCVIKADGKGPYQEVGKSLLGNYDAPKTLNEVSKLFNEAAKRSCSKFGRRDTLAGKLWRVIICPEKISESIRSSCLGLYYTSFQNGGNHGSMLWSYPCLGGKEVRVLIAPGTFESILERLLLKIKDFIFVRVGLQHPSKHEEKPRVEQALIAEGRQALAVNLPFDGNPSWLLKPFPEENLVAFWTRYEAALAEDRGYQNVEEECQVTASGMMQTVFSFSTTTPISVKKAQAFKSIFLAFIEFKILDKQLERLTNEQKIVYVMSACRQSADRGAIFTALMYLLYLLAKKRLLFNPTQVPQENLKKDLQTLFGVLFGRALLAEGGAPLKKRIDLITGVFDIFGEDLQAVDNLPEAFSQNLPQIQ